MSIHSALHRAFWPLALFACFVIAGNLGLYCEALHHSLVMSCGIFGLSFSSMVAGAAKLYHFLA